MSESENIKIGILALQGDFAKHDQAIRALGEQTILVRTTTELAESDGLIIPGGESTTLTNLLKKHGLWQEIESYAKRKPVFGTCAGLIILSNRVTANHLQTLNLIDITVARNAYGRQIDSFIDDVEIHLAKPEKLEGVFIRAPKIVEIGKSVKALGWHKDNIIMAESGNILVATFHPELSTNPAIHQYFLEKVKRNNGAS